MKQEAVMLRLSDFVKNGVQRVHRFKQAFLSAANEESSERPGKNRSAGRYGDNTVKKYFTAICRH